jgi:hypothetical protein
LGFFYNIIIFKSYSYNSTRRKYINPSKLLEDHAFDDARATDPMKIAPVEMTRGMNLRKQYAKSRELAQALANGNERPSVYPHNLHNLVQPTTPIKE